MSPKPGPKKKVDMTKRYKDTQGSHVVSPDGSHMKIGGSTFKRTVLPSVAAPKTGPAAPVIDIEELEEKTFKEASSESLD
jgi:hypothetical protein